jgi:hypothetical protein
MKVSKSLVGLLVVTALAATSASVVAGRASAPSVGYYSDAAMTHMVGEIDYSCAGPAIKTGDTSTPYHKILETMSCGGSKGGGDGDGQTCYLHDPFSGSPVLDCYP